jgi:zeaxanthin glucosyltransferase
VGEFLEEGDLTAKRPQQLIQRVLDNPGYREKARYFQKVIAQTQGLDLAAGLIERAFGKTQPSALAEKVPALSSI